MYIFVPYRDRKSHLDLFIPHLKKYLPDCKIFICEQFDNKLFNREKLINVLYKEIKPDYFVAHDVDMLPEKVDYTPRKGVTQLASSTIQLYDYLGGATMYDADIFERVGGYHNSFWGGRGGDNCMMFNLKRLKIPVAQRHGTFISLPHERSSPEFIPSIWEKAQLKRKIQNQLSICEYEIIDKIQIEERVIKISVKL